jgi:hypothetical protein
MPGSFSDPALIKILFNSIILVLSWPVRKEALNIGALYSLPQILGMIWAGQLTLRFLFTSRFTPSNNLHGEEVHKEIIRASLWGLGASWFLWYLAMALFWPRYIFPPFFIGCIYFTAYLDKLSNGFDLRFFIRRTSALLLGREFNRNNVQAVILLLAFSVILPVMVKTTLLSLLTPVNDPSLASTYLLNNIPTGAKVETFESELYFLAPEIKYHFPTDLVSMQLVRKWKVDPQLSIEYDPLETDPDYLVVGPYARTWHPYDEVYSQGWLQLEADIGGYQIYQIRTTPIIK